MLIRANEHEQIWMNNLFPRMPAASFAFRSRLFRIWLCSLASFESGLESLLTSNIIWSNEHKGCLIRMDLIAVNYIVHDSNFTRSSVKGYGTRKNDTKIIDRMSEILIRFPFPRIFEFLNFRHTRTFGIGTTFMLFFFFFPEPIAALLHSSWSYLSPYHLFYWDTIISKAVRRFFSPEGNAELSRRIYVAKFINHSSKTGAPGNLVFGVTTPSTKQYKFRFGSIPIARRESALHANCSPFNRAYKRRDYFRLSISRGRA